MNPKNVAEIRKIYLKRLPEGFSKKEILDMDCFLKEDNPFEELFD